jgi:HTH-type transcriptional regulator / antitoxin MqsA
MAQSKNSKSSKRKKAVKSNLKKPLCTVCGGQRENGTVTLSYRVNERWIMIEDVPASICRLCGEKYFTPAVSERVLEVVNKLPMHAKTITIPVIAFNAA